jgi:hypothetical protein
LQLLWDFRNEQRPAGEPQQPDDPIDNEPKAPFDYTTAAPEDDLGESAADRGLIIRPPGFDVGKLRPKVMLHIHISEEALLSYHNGKPGIAGGPCRLEGVGPLTLGQVRRFLADTGCE